MTTPPPIPEQQPPAAPTPALRFTCSICGDPSSDICHACTRDNCANHLCMRCLCCSDCCRCEVSKVNDRHVAGPSFNGRMATTVAQPALEAAEDQPAPNHLWTDFLRYSARQSKVGSVRTFDGLEATWTNSTLPFMNGTFFTSAPEDAGDVVRRVEAAKQDAAAHPLPWMLFTYDPDFAEFPIPAECGLDRVLAVRVMTGDAAQLELPVHPLPALEFRRVTDDATARQALDINVQAYGMPAEMTESLLATGACFSNPAQEYGYVAYLDGEAVSTASVIVLDDSWLYVALVATLPAHRKKGYAEAVMRHALEQAAAATGVTRTSLDATDAGAPIYEQMGYSETGESWSAWMLRHTG